jgi:hypothetical protein
MPINVYSYRKITGRNSMRMMSVLKRLLVITFSMLVVACGGGATGGGPETGGSNVSGSLSQSGMIATGAYTLSWDAVPDPAVLGYRVYFATSPFSNGKILGQFDTTATSIVFQPGVYGIAAGSMIYMGVSALGANGLESPVSKQVSINVQ